MLRGLVTVVLVGAVGGAAAAEQTPSSQIELGRKVYEREKCATCHQIDKKGNSRFPLDGVAKRLAPTQLRMWLTDTRRMEQALPRLPAIRMSARKFRLKDVELDALVAYLKTLK
jgi:mono/diheme cytochrome c family protein